MVHRLDGDIVTGSNGVIQVRSRRHLELTADDLEPSARVVRKGESGRSPESGSVAERLPTTVPAGEAQHRGVDKGDVGGSLVDTGDTDREAFGKREPALIGRSNRDGVTGGSLVIQACARRNLELIAGDLETSARVVGEGEGVRVSGVGVRGRERAHDGAARGILIHRRSVQGDVRWSAVGHFGPDGDRGVHIQRPDSQAGVPGKRLPTVDPGPTTGSDADRKLAVQRPAQDAPVGTPCQPVPIACGQRRLVVIVLQNEGGARGNSGKLNVALPVVLPVRTCRESSPG